MKKIICTVLILMFTSLNLFAFDYTVKEDIFEISKAETAQQYENIKTKKRVYIVNEDGTVEFLKTTRRLYIVNEDGTVEFLN